MCVSIRPGCLLSGVNNAHRLPFGVKLFHLILFSGTLLASVSLRSVSVYFQFVTAVCCQV